LERGYIAEYLHQPPLLLKEKGTGDEVKNRRRETKG
jgi:hypothetical protein